ncbi:MAG: HAMP domain-containing protein [Gammaproteobacteria bacterium]|nr:HAMP domain-containing protein [Gammaproteobacteria bacterium]
MSLLPRTLFGRLVLLMAGGLVLAQLLGAALHLSERQRTIGTTVGHELAQRVAAVHRAIDSQNGSARQELAERLSTPRQHLSVVAQAPEAVTSVSETFEFLSHLAEVLGRETAIRPVVLPSAGDFMFELYLELKSGGWLRIEGSVPRAIFSWPLHLFGNLTLMLTIVLLLIWGVARMTVRPLTRLAQAARGLGDDLHQPPLVEEGPSEVREAAQAFNAMQRRIRHDIEERERFLAAVSHDLKTPVTRMRLRSELLIDDHLRERFRRDLDEMQQMLGGALDFLRGKAVDEAICPIDIVALLESLVDDQLEMGHEIALTVPSVSLRFAARPQALRRAIGNLINNALKDGQHVNVDLQLEAGALCILVEDEGPGLPVDELDKVFEPFYRMERSRNRETGGVGLGLAIVRQVAWRHGGDITLSNRPGGGLRALLRLPQ